METYNISPETEPIFNVDLDIRTITVPDILKNIGVSGDNNAETIYFKVSDTFDGIPLNDMTVYIQFQNANKEYYSSKTTDISHDIPGFLTVGWKIDHRLTRYAGKVKFQLQFTAQDYVLNTTPAELNILEGLNISTEAPDPSETVIEQFNRRLGDIENALRNIQDQVSIFPDFQDKINQVDEEINALKNATSFLKNNVIYIS